MALPLAGPPAARAQEVPPVVTGEGAPAAEVPQTVEVPAVATPVPEADPAPPTVAVEAAPTPGDADTPAPEPAPAEAQVETAAPTPAPEAPADEAAVTPPAPVPAAPTAPPTDADVKKAAKVPTKAPAKAPETPKPAPAPAPPPPKVDWALVRNPVASTEASIQRGRVLYNGKALCSVCHGEKGDGFGSVRSQFNPYPNAFFDPSWHRDMTDGKFMGVLSEGKYGTGMVPLVPDFLTQEEGWDVINFVRTFQGKTTEAYARYQAFLRERGAEAELPEPETFVPSGDTP